MKAKRILTLCLITAIFLSLAVPVLAVAPTQYFRDVTTSTAHHEDINKLAEMGVITGDGNGTFRPESVVSVAEALTMIERHLGDPANLPSTWSEWGSLGMYPGKWFDASIVNGAYLDGGITHRVATHMVLSIKEMKVLPLNMYPIPYNFGEHSSLTQAYNTCIVYGYTPLLRETQSLATGITRAEFSNLLVWATELEQEIPPIEYTPIIPVHFESEFTDYEKEYRSMMAYSAYSLLPEHLLHSFVADGYTLRMKDGDGYRLHVSRYEEHLHHSTAYFIRRTSTKNGYIMTSTSSQKTLIHEFGHYVHNLCTEKEAISALFLDEQEVEGVVKVALSSYAKSDEGEFFAEAFAFYFIRGNELKKEAPQIYALIEKIITP